MNGYSTFLKTPELEPHHQRVLGHMPDTRWGGGLTPLQRCSRRILQPQPTGLTFVGGGGVLTSLERFSRCVFDSPQPRQLGGHITVCKEVFENNFSQIWIQMYNERNSLTTRHNILRVRVHFWIISSLIYICLLNPLRPDKMWHQVYFLKGF